MAPKAGGTPPGGKHEYAVPFAHVGDLFAKYKERDAEKVALVDVTQDTCITFGLSLIHI